MTNKTIKIVAGAFGTSDYGNSPSYAVFDVNSEFIARIEKIIGICDDNNLSEARIHAEPIWGPGNIGEELHLMNGELVFIRRGEFWFADYPKHEEITIQSRALSIASIKLKFDSANNGDVIYMTDNDCIKEMYLEDCNNLADEA